MRLRCFSLLACPVEQLASELTRPFLLGRMSWPLLTFTPVDPPTWPERWELTPHVFSLAIAGRLPLGRHTIDPQPPAGGPEVWHDAGHSDLIRLWDHRIELEDVHGMTRYTDVVEVRAGLLTPAAWLFASVFYRHRQRRLNRLITGGFAEGAEGRR